MITNNNLCLTTNINNKKINKVLADLKIDESIELSEVFQLLGDITRLKILQALALEELCVCEIAVISEISQSAASHQLRRLKDAKLVKKRRSGQKIFYSLYDDHIYDFLKIAFNHIEHLTI